MSTKALFLDLDGTLLNDQKEITPGNRSAIERALKEGHKVIINTGRPLVSAVEQAEKLGLTEEGCYVVSYNGGILYDMGNRKEIFKMTIPLSYVGEVFDEANRRELHIQTYGQEKVLVEARCDDYPIRRYCSIIHMEYKVIDDVHNLTEEPVKMLLQDLETMDRLREFESWILEKYDGILDAFFSCKEYLEIVPKGLNKGNALRQMARLLDIPMENTIAVGDAANDYTMIKAAHLGVCMQNGTDEMKAAADYVTEKDNNHDGIQEVIEKFIFD